MSQKRGRINLLIVSFQLKKLSALFWARHIIATLFFQLIWKKKQVVNKDFLAMDVPDIFLSSGIAKVEDKTFLVSGRVTVSGLQPKTTRKISYR